MQPAVQATSRTPGPSTADPVVKEWRKPMSPLASAERTSVSGTCAPSFTRSSYGLRAEREAGGSGGDCDTDAPSVPVERPVDHVHPLLAREADEVDGVARHADGQARVLLGMLHGVEERLAV